MRFSPSEIERVRSSVRISDIIGRFVTWDRKKTNPGRGDFWACCPFHGEKNPSFHCEDPKGRYHCFGCGATGDVFRFLEEKAGLSFAEAVRELGGAPEKLAETPTQRREREKAQARAREHQERKSEAKRLTIREIAYGIWRSCLPIGGTLAELYLRNRGIDFPLDFPSLRFHPALQYRDPKSEGILGEFPALVAAVQAPDDDRFLGVWRIYITEEGHKRTDVPNAKLGLGRYTDAGGGVRLGPQTGRVNIAEGIETGLGVFGLLGGREAVLCGLSSAGVAAVRPGPDASAFHIWPDPDPVRIRRVEYRGQMEDRSIPSSGLKAAATLTEWCREHDFPVTTQPMTKTGLDGLDLYNKSKMDIDNGAYTARKSLS